MPVYEYQCTECGQIEEAFQKISDPELETCGHCRGSLKKLISQSSFHLKGSGWYVTDYGGSKNITKPSSKANTKDTKSASKKEKTSK
ncbi:MAG: zinc ribbon domain-containing protein [Desulfobacteraceae bacterium]|nr:zinc ribbon domain-containing protein [Desulfobacteraceae bacterium]